MTLQKNKYSKALLLLLLLPISCLKQTNPFIGKWKYKISEKEIVSRNSIDFDTAAVEVKENVVVFMTIEHKITLLSQHRLEFCPNGEAFDWLRKSEGLVAPNNEPWILEFVESNTVMFGVKGGRKKYLLVRSNT